jgi:hypothetical protein
MVVLQEEIKNFNIKNHHVTKNLWKEREIKNVITGEDLDIIFPKHYAFSNYPKDILITTC